PRARMWRVASKAQAASIAGADSPSFEAVCSGKATPSASAGKTPHEVVGRAQGERVEPERRCAFYVAGEVEVE
ncbi:MAG TPA: hypothetical protein VIY73_22240, partial [Polyangiaceae bacterium]